MFENGWWGMHPSLVTNCDETFTSQKANQWKRNSLILPDSEIVERHYSRTV